MTQILKDPILAPAVISYLVHRIQSLSMETGDPQLLIVDETTALLRNKMFGDRFLDTGLMEGRKLRQAYVLAFQTVQAMIATGRGQVIMDQCQRQIFFRLGRDSDDAIDQYKAFGLNQAELDFLARRTFRNFPYGILIRNNASGESAIVNADLTRLGNYMRMFKSGTESVSRLDTLLGSMSRERAVRAYIEGG